MYLPVKVFPVDEEIKTAGFAPAPVVLDILRFADPVKFVVRAKAMPFVAVQYISQFWLVLPTAKVAIVNLLEFVVAKARPLDPTVIVPEQVISAVASLTCMPCTEILPVKVPPSELVAPVVQSARSPVLGTAAASAPVVDTVLQAVVAAKLVPVDFL